MNIESGYGFELACTLKYSESEKPEVKTCFYKFIEAKAKAR